MRQAKPATLSRAAKPKTQPRGRIPGVNGPVATQHRGRGSPANAPEIGQTEMVLNSVTALQDQVSKLHEVVRNMTNNTVASAASAEQASIKIPDLDGRGALAGCSADTDYFQEMGERALVRSSSEHRLLELYREKKANAANAATKTEKVSTPANSMQSPISPVDSAPDADLESASSRNRLSVCCVEGSTLSEGNPMPNTDPSFIGLHEVKRTRSFSRTRLSSSPHLTPWKVVVKRFQESGYAIDVSPSSPTRRNSVSSQPYTVATAQSARHVHADLSHRFGSTRFAGVLAALYSGLLSERSVDCMITQNWAGSHRVSEDGKVIMELQNAPLDALSMALPDVRFDAQMFEDAVLDTLRVPNISRRTVRIMFRSLATLHGERLSFDNLPVDVAAVDGLSSPGASTMTQSGTDAPGESSHILRRSSGSISSTGSVRRTSSNSEKFEDGTLRNGPGMQRISADAFQTSLRGEPMDKALATEMSGRGREDDATFMLPGFSMSRRRMTATPRYSVRNDGSPERARTGSVGSSKIKGGTRGTSGSTASGASTPGISKSCASQRSNNVVNEDCSRDSMNSLFSFAEQLKARYEKQRPITQNIHVEAAATMCSEKQRPPASNDQIAEAEAEQIQHGQPCVNAAVQPNGPTIGSQFCQHVARFSQNSLTVSPAESSRLNGISDSAGSTMEPQPTSKLGHEVYPAAEPEGETPKRRIVPQQPAINSGLGCAVSAGVVTTLEGNVEAPPEGINTACASRSFASYPYNAQAVSAIPTVGSSATAANFGHLHVMPAAQSAGAVPVISPRCPRCLSPDMISPRVRAAPPPVQDAASIQQEPTQACQQPCPPVMMGHLAVAVLPPQLVTPRAPGLVAASGTVVPPLFLQARPMRSSSTGAIGRVPIAGAPLSNAMQLAAGNRPSQSATSPFAHTPRYAPGPLGQPHQLHRPPPPFANSSSGIAGKQVVRGIRSFSVAHESRI